MTTPATPPPSRRAADLALLLGLLSLPFSVFAGVPAVVLGVRALRVAGQAGGRRRAWTGVALGATTTLVALLVLVVLGVRAVDGLRDLTAQEGSTRAQQRAAERAAVDDAALVQAVGVPLERLRTTAGVVLRHDAGATVDCVDSCSTAELEVPADVARTGPLARDALLERLQSRGYRDALGGGTGCPPLDPARPCRLRGRDGTGSLVLVPAPVGPGYVLRVDGGS